MSASEHLQGNQFDYRGSHQAPADGSPLHDLTGDDMPPDVYKNPQYYTHGGGNKYDAEAVRSIHAYRGRPNAPVTVYRAAPQGVTHINPGDWVATSPTYAKQHAASQGNPHGDGADWPIHSAQVPASTVRNGGNDIIEWGYHGAEPVPVKTKMPPKRGWTL